MTQSVKSAFRLHLKTPMSRVWWKPLVSAMGRKRTLADQSKTPILQQSICDLGSRMHEPHPRPTRSPKSWTADEPASTSHRAHARRGVTLGTFRLSAPARRWANFPNLSRSADTGRPSVCPLVEAGVDAMALAPHDGATPGEICLA
jgi:hypothetical protein